MPSIKENIAVWNKDYNWSKQGNEWSRAWGSSEMLWYGTLLPRIQSFIPCGTILEIAPGFGRWTHYLRELCDKMIAVDLSEKCIEACRERFQNESKITFHVNDGFSLAMVEDLSIDFVFSFDSLVHAEDDVIQSYLKEIEKKLKPGGTAFIHHSNLAFYKGYFDLLDMIPRGRGLLTKKRVIDSKHWRAASMSGEKFIKFSLEVGLQCISQEWVNWDTKRLIDCISVVRKQKSTSEVKIYKNFEFTNEADRLRRLGNLYGVFKNSNS